MDNYSTLRLCTKALYEELETHELLALQQLDSTVLAAEIRQLEQSKKALDTLSYEPSQTSIDIILKHSRETEALESTF